MRNEEYSIEEKKKNDKEEHESNEKCSVMNESCLSPTVITYQLYMMNRWYFFFSIFPPLSCMPCFVCITFNVQKHIWILNWWHEFRMWQHSMAIDVVALMMSTNLPISFAECFQTQIFFFLFTFIWKFQWTHQPRHVLSFLFRIFFFIPAV